MSRTRRKDSGTVVSNYITEKLKRSERFKFPKAALGYEGREFPSNVQPDAMEFRIGEAMARFIADAHSYLEGKGDTRYDIHIPADIPLAYIGVGKKAEPDYHDAAMYHITDIVAGLVRRGLEHDLEPDHAKADYPLLGHHEGSLDTFVSDIRNSMSEE